MNLVAYVRVSTEEQAASGLSIEGQKRRIQKYCECYAHNLVAVYSDEGVSAKNLQRPAVGLALAMLQQEHIDGLIICKLDRLVRSARDAAAILDLVDKYKKALVSVDEHLDTKTAQGRFFYSITAAYAQMERELCSERTKQALAVKKANGSLLGRPPIPKATLELAWNLKTFGWDGVPGPAAWSAVAEELQRRGVAKINKGTLCRSVARIKREECLV